MKKNIQNNRGQAAVETALSLPILIWLVYYTINAFYSIHSGHVGQKYAAMNLYERLDNRAQFAVDDVADQVHRKDYMAVQYTEANGTAPKRKIVVGPINIVSVTGVCKEPQCN